MEIVSKMRHFLRVNLINITNFLQVFNKIAQWKVMKVRKVYLVGWKIKIKALLIGMKKRKNYQISKL